VRDIFTADFEGALVDDEQQFQRLTSFFTRTSPELLEHVELYEDKKTALFEKFGVEKVIDGLMSRRVDLPSGGYLMIDYAEALTVIDVNSGSFTGRGKGARLEDTILRTNLEAAEAVVNELRLRDIGGIIVIDFIDMAAGAQPQRGPQDLRKSLEEDRTKTFTAEISKLGLVEMTRQNVTEGVREIMSRRARRATARASSSPRRPSPSRSSAPARHRRAADGRRRGVPRADEPARQLAVHRRQARVLHELEADTGKFFHFTGTDGLPVDHFDVLQEGKRAEIEERAIPWRDGDEVMVEIIEPHMYNVDDAVAKIDGYVISVTGAGPLVGERRLVRLTEVGRTAATAVLLGDDGEPVNAAEEMGVEGAKRRRGRRGGRRRSAKAGAAES
jgi:ribonuclease G